jgi:endonuclease YncB( thermonuclease family)
MWDRRAALVRAHDGDTIIVVLDQGFGDTKEISLRLLGVYAPELSQAGGKECLSFVSEWLHTNTSPSVRWPFVVTTARMKVADREQKTLDRFVGTVTTLDGSRNLNLELSAYIESKGYVGGIGAS